MVDEIKTEVTRVYRRAGRFFDKLFDTLDSELVTFYQCLFYLLVGLNCLWTLFNDDAPPSALEETLTPTQYLMFLVGGILSPVALFLGKWMHGRMARTGAIFELLGDIAFSGVSSVWVVAIYYTQWGQRTVFATVYVLAAVFCTWFFIVRDIRRLNDKDRWVDPQ